MNLTTCSQGLALDNFRGAPTLNTVSTEKPTQLFFSLVRDTLASGIDSTKTPLLNASYGSLSALWLQAGSIAINGKPLQSENGINNSNTDTIANLEKMINTQ